MPQMALLLSETTSEGEKDDSKDDARVASRKGDPSCLDATVTSALHREDLVGEKERES